MRRRRWAFTAAGMALLFLLPLQGDGTTETTVVAGAPSSRPHVDFDLGTTTTSMTTTTAPRVRRPAPSRVSRSQRRTPATIASRSATVASGDSSSPDFWRRLANCESPTGRSGRFIGYFQFSRDTAAKVGIDGSESYEEQRAAAQRWLRMIGGRGGSRSGWPTCWWVAKR